MQHPRTFYSPLSIFAVLCVTACAPIENIERNEQAAKNRYDQVTGSINRHDMTVGADPERTIRVDNGYWVATDIEVMDQEAPSWFSTRRDDYITGDALTLDQLTAYFRAKWNLKISRASELVPRDTKDLTNATSVVETVIQDSTFSTPNSSTTASGDGLLAYVPTPTFRLNMIDVTPAQAMDSIAEAMGIQWRFSRNEGVTFYYYDTQRFRIAKTGDGGKIQSIISTSGTASDSGGDSQSTGGTQESSLSGSITIEPKFWENTKRTLESLASPYGRVLVNTSTGDVVVTDTVDGIARVDSYINELNKELSLKAHVSLSLVRLRHTRERGLGLNLDVIYAKANQASLAFESSRRVIEGASSVVGEITDPSSHLNGSNFFLDALSSYGDISVLRNKDFVLRNHSTYLLGKGRNIPYLESVGSTNTADVGSTETSEIVEKFAGFGVGFYTRILNQDRALFNVMLDLTDFARFQSIQISSDQTSDVPLLDRESHQQEYELRDGQSQVLLSVDLSETSRDNNYVAGKDNCLAGCNESESTQREYLLYVMTVRVI